MHSLIKHCSWLGLLLISVQLHAMDIQIQDPQVRAVPPTAQVTAAFMKISNQGSEERALVDASSPASAAVELHTHSEVDGVMQMRRLSEIKLPAGETTELKPGGLHLMLIDLHEGLAKDAQVEITLTLDDGSLIELSVPVKAVHGQHHGGGHRHH